MDETTQARQQGERNRNKIKRLTGITKFDRIRNGVIGAELRQELQIVRCKKNQKDKKRNTLGDMNPVNRRNRYQKERNSERNGRSAQSSELKAWKN